MKRKTFIKRTLSGIAAAIAGLYVTESCSSSEDAAPVATENCLENGAKHSSISLNHGHTLIIPKEDVVAGAAKSYVITGTATHAHEVQVTMDLFAKLKNNEQVSVLSSLNADHTHQITIKCA